VAMALR